MSKKGKYFDCLLEIVLLVGHYFVSNKKINRNKANDKMIRHVSLFSQLVKLVDRNQLYRLVSKHQADRYSKGFDSYDQFVFMLFCQLAQAKSLREISSGLSSCMNQFCHLWMKDAPKKSTLSYANANRSWEMAWLVDDKF